MRGFARWIGGLIVAAALAGSAWAQVPGACSPCTAKIGTNNLVTDTGFSGPVSVPADFMGLSNSSFGGYAAHYSRCNPTFSVGPNLNGFGQPVITVTNPSTGCYNSNSYGQSLIATLVTAGGGATTQATWAFSLNTGTGAVTGVYEVSPGNYTTPSGITATVNNTGGFNIPQPSFKQGSVRTHDYAGSVWLTGATSIRNTKWDNWSNGAGTYNWTALDEIITGAKAIGATVMFTFTGTPAAYAISGCTSSAPNDIEYSSCPLSGVPPADNLTGATLGFSGEIADLQALMTRYGTTNPAGLTNPVTGQVFPSNTQFIDYFECGNEAHTGVNGAGILPTQSTSNYWVGSAQQYVDMCRTASLTVKSINSGVKIVGIVSSTGYLNYQVPTYSPNSYFEPYWLLTTTDSVDGLVGCHWYDAVSFHPYGGQSHNSNYMPAPEVFDVSYEVGQFKNLIKQECSGTLLPIFATEVGALFNSGDSFFGLTATQQGTYLKRVIAEMAVAGVHSVYPFEFGGADLGYPALTPAIARALSDLAVALPGRSISGVKRGPDGNICLTFSTGYPATWCSG